MSNPVLVSFNGFGYDMPVLMRRSQYLGIPYPNLSMDRYRSPHVDLMQRLTWNGAIKAHGLKFYAKRFGIPYTDDTSGSQIAALVKAGNWPAVAAHCKSDVEITAALAKRLNMLPPDAIVFDLEAVAIDGAAEFIEPVSAPSNYKDPDKIAAYVAAETEKAASKCALDPDLCRIVAVGFSLNGDGVAVEWGDDEPAMLRHFWQAFAQQPTEIF